jgi:hypothetical protein
MPRYFMELLTRSPQRFGTLLALIGVLVLTPDTLVIRLSGLERWALMGWRWHFNGGDVFAVMAFIANARCQPRMAQPCQLARRACDHRL